MDHHQSFCLQDVSLARREQVSELGAARPCSESLWSSPLSNFPFYLSDMSCRRVRSSRPPVRRVLVDRLDGASQRVPSCLGSSRAIFFSPRPGAQNPLRWLSLSPLTPFSFPPPSPFSFFLYKMAANGSAVAQTGLPAGQ